MNTLFIRISLKKRIFISYCLIGLFFFLGENCYASKRPVFRETVRKASADNSTVRGRVVDVSGEPLIGATIREKGGTRGTVTDIEGNFILSVPDSAVLQVSFVGYESIEVSVGGRKTLEIQLRENTVMLDNVIITALGLEKKEASLAYSIQKVKGEELTRMKEVNMITALAGKAAGVQINKNSSGIGGSAKVSLRGIRSASGDNQPLYVIDGVPMLNIGTEQAYSAIGGTANAGNRDGGDGISNLNPEDVESISILKGASAAALYGAVAANGVIMITTKKGREGKIRIDVSSNMTAETVFNLPELQNTFGVPMNSKTGKPSTFYSWGDQMDIDGFDQIKDFYQVGYNFNNSVAVSGGSQNSQSYFSYGNTSSRGVMPTNTFVRHNLSGRQTFKAFNEKLTMDFSGTYTYSETKNKPGGGMLDNPLVGLYVIPRNVDYGYYRDNYELFNAERPTVPTQNWIVEDYTSLEEHNQNPYWMLNRGIGKSIRHRFTTSGTLKYQILDCLSIQGRLSYERDNTNFRREKYASTYRLSMGAYSETMNFYEHLFGDALVSFNKTWNDFTVAATAALLKR